MGEIRRNRTKQKLANGEVVSMLMGLNTPALIDSMGPLGFDAVLIECEHGPIDFADIPAYARACDLWGMTSIVRVNQNNYNISYRTLDMGVQGIVIPHVNTEEEARLAVEGTRFAPMGSRGMSGGRQSYGVDNYFDKANDEILVSVLIEDIAAVNNLDDILKVGGIDVFYVATNDLAQSMGLLGQGSHPEVLAAIDRAIDKIVAAGRTVGAIAVDATMEAYIKKGVLFFGISWQPWVTSGAASYLSKVASLAK